MPVNFRCDCPITSAIDILGDKWMLVIVKQMLVDDKWTFKDFIESDEAVASNVLSTKLKMLGELGIISKSKLPNNKKTNLYHLTEMGLSLAPVIVELALWSDGNLRPMNPILRNDEGLEMMKANKQAFTEEITKRYKEKLASIIYSS